MGKITIHCVRHAQGYHNLETPGYENLHDPLLTRLGEEQCTQLAALFPYHSSITHLVASPLKRTLYTCLLSFPSEVSSGLKVLAIPELQENGNIPCDTGSDPDILAKELADGTFAGRYKDSVDLSRVHAGWNSKTGKWSQEDPAIHERATAARKILLGIGQEALEASGGKEVGIVVVTHGGFLHFLTEDYDGDHKFTGTGWANTEYRAYEFKSGSDRASLQETLESEKRRHKIPLTHSEVRELHVAEPGVESHL